MLAALAVARPVAPAPDPQPPQSAQVQLLEQFGNAAGFGAQFEVARQLVRLQDPQVLPVLEGWLDDEDRHVRANAAYVHAGLGDDRGFEVLGAILADRSDRPLGQGIPGGSFDMDAPRWWLRIQIEADRSYAVHVLGELRDARGLALLLPLLAEDEVNYTVAWALGHIGDRQAIEPLIASLGHPDALRRVSAIEALRALHATEALPHLRRLLNDQALPSAGPRVPVADTAKAAITTLTAGR